MRPALWIGLAMVIVLTGAGAWWATRPRASRIGNEQQRIIAEVIAWAARPGARDDREYPWEILRRGDAYAATGDLWNAIADYETVCQSFAASEAFVDAVKRELDIGVRLARTEIADPRLERASGSVKTGEELLFRTVVRLPGSPEAERALFELAELDQRTGDTETAIQTYQMFLQLFPKSSRRPLVSDRLQGLERPAR